MKWSEANEAEKKYFQKLVADFLSQIANKAITAKDVTKQMIKDHWKSASAYFRTSDDLEFDD